MTFDPSALALCALVLLGSALLTEAYLTYRDWYRRWRERRRPMPQPTPQTTPQPTPRPRLVVRRPAQDADDQSPYGHGTSLIQ